MDEPVCRYPVRGVERTTNTRVQAIRLSASARSSFPNRLLLLCRLNRRVEFGFIFPGRLACLCIAAYPQYGASAPLSFLGAAAAARLPRGEREGPHPSSTGASVIETPRAETGAALSCGGPSSVCSMRARSPGMHGTDGVRPNAAPVPRLIHPGSVEHNYAHLNATSFSSAASSFEQGHF